MATNKRVFTLRLEDEVFERIGVLATAEHRSMTNYIEFIRLNMHWRKISHTRLGVLVVPFILMVIHSMTTSDTHFRLERSISGAISILWQPKKSIKFL